MFQEMLQTGHPRDWHDMLSASITTAGEIAKHLPVDPSHIRNVISRYPMRINPYYLSLIKSSKSKEGGLFKQVVPDIQEISND
ncbi:MAG: hypothetical protein JRJ39_14195, partial [Deltaproteobacteria bacterium]|nr:hypothetical protein [Deltaproteobacteria bacterium]